MNGHDFKRWRKAMKLSQVAAAERTGWSRASIWRAEGAPDDPIPLSIALACAALWHRLPPWSDATEDSDAGERRR